MNAQADATVPRLTGALSAIRGGDHDAAREYLGASRLEHVLAHDGLRDVNARTLDEIHRRYGQAFADPFCSAVYEETTVWYVGKVPEPATFRAAAEAVAMLWHWHMTTFRLLEDDEKLTYILEPCGSGGRLINEGMYYGTRKDGLSIIPDASDATFGEQAFPSYCTHCADHNRTFLKRGYNIMVFEGWTRAHRYGACLSHVFKRLDALPDEFYSRIGIHPSDVPETNYIPEFTRRVFTDEELVGLAEHPVSRALAALDRGDPGTAAALIEQSWAAWMGLHGAYRVWHTAFCNHMHTLGPQARDEVMGACTWRLVQHALNATVTEHRDPLDVWPQFWRSHGEPVEMVVSHSHCLYRVAPAALVDPDLSASWSHSDLADLCRAVMRGVESNGFSDAFGTLELRGERLEHRVPRL